MDHANTVKMLLDHGAIQANTWLAYMPSPRSNYLWVRNFVHSSVHSYDSFVGYIWHN